MRKRILLVAVLALAACQSEADRLEDQYEIAKSDTLNKDDECIVAGKLRDAYLEEGDREKYRHWNAMAETCAYLR